MLTLKAASKSMSLERQVCDGGPVSMHICPRVSFKACLRLNVDPGETTASPGCCFHSRGLKTMGGKDWPQQGHIYVKEQWS